MKAKRTIQKQPVASRPMIRGTTKKGVKQDAWRAQVKQLQKQLTSGNGDEKGKKKGKIIILGPAQLMRGIIYIVMFVYMLGMVWSMGGEKIREVSLSEAIETIKTQKTEKITVSGNKITINLKDDAGEVVTRKGPEVSFEEVLQNENIALGEVNLSIKDDDSARFWLNILLTVASVALPIAFIYFVMKQMGKAQNGIFSFGKSRAKLFVQKKEKLTFDDVAGADEAKQELKEVVDFLKNPDRYRKMGARIPRGVLLVGPAGVGKTLLARSVAGEAGVPFFSMAGSEFMEMLVGVGASRVRDLFDTAKKAGRAIIFIDEIDAIGRARGGGGMGGGHDEREQTLNQILVEMDGFEQNTTVIVLAATNRGDLLDSALLRPGRFDRRVTLDMPDIEDRKAILAIHAKNKPFVRSVKWDTVAKRTVGFSGADIENMLNEAAIRAARLKRDSIDMADIEEAALKVKLGPEKKRLQSEREKKMTAYHEAGHAVVTYIAPEMDPVHRISIVSRGMALGFTLIPPKKDRVQMTKKHLLAQLASLMGGRAAEEMVFSETTTGAASDIMQATRIARAMVIEWGMSSLGPVNWGPRVEETDWGGQYQVPGDVSEAQRAKIDTEVKTMVETAYKQAVTILKDNRQKLDKVAEVLVEKETLEEEDFAKLMQSKV